MFVGNSNAQTAAESDARAREALEAEASAEGAARAVAAACESVAQRLAGDLGHRKVIAKLRKENEALIKAKGEVEASSYREYLILWYKMNCTVGFVDCSFFLRVPLACLGSMAQGTIMCSSFCLLVLFDDKVHAIIQLLDVLSGPPDRA